MTAIDLDNSSDLLSSPSEWINSHRWSVLSGLVGLLFVSGGIFLVGSNFFEQPKVEILGVETQSKEEAVAQEMVVEVSGSVESPGVYKIAKESRIDDLLVAAGGLSKSADRTYVEKNINRASKLIDGQKIYIPKIGDQAQVMISSASTGVTSSSKDVTSGKININSASLKELDSLSGIGATRAQAIIDQRPYTSIEDLVTKKVIPKSVFEKVKESIIAQ
jgi:competence protein ComEA